MQQQDIDNKAHIVERLRTPKNIAIIPEPLANAGMGLTALPAELLEIALRACA